MDFFIRTKKCPNCGRIDVLKVTAEMRQRYERWKFGEGLIQNMLPELTVSQREQLMTGFCDPCWQKCIVTPEDEE